MTSIKLTVTGAKVRAMVDGILTSGMVGIPVTIEYDEAWEGLKKNLVCRSGQWYGPVGDTRTILNVDSQSTVAHEVMVAGKTLYLGLEGYNADGTLVIPTIWADCGRILPGANSEADPSVDPELPVYAQLDRRMDEIQAQGVNVTGAAVGQIVQIAAVDENGAPIAWAPVDLPDGQGEWFTQEYNFFGEYVEGIRLDLPREDIKEAYLTVSATHNGEPGTQTCRVYADVETKSDYLDQAIILGVASLYTSTRSATIAYRVLMEDYVRCESRNFGSGGLDGLRYISYVPKKFLYIVPLSTGVMIAGTATLRYRV